MRRDEDLFFSSGGGYYSAPPIDLSVVFIAETWIDKARLNSVLRKIDFDHKWVVPRKG